MVQFFVDPNNTKTKIGCETGSSQSQVAVVPQNHINVLPLDPNLDSINTVDNFDLNYYFDDHIAPSDNLGLGSLGSDYNEDVDPVRGFT
jgi:hypothetical protein